MIENNPSIYKQPSIYNQGGVEVEHSVELGTPPNNVFYGTQKIGSLYWTTENLDLNLGWATGCADSATPIAGYYNNNSTYNHEGKRYGLLYNWPGAIAINTYLQSINSKWRVPSTSDVQQLIDYIGGTLQCVKLRTNYNWDNNTGTNESGFSAFGTGFYESGFYSIDEVNYIWSTDSVNTTTAKSFQIGSGINCEIQNDSKRRCYSIRLCCDA